MFKSSHSPINLIYARSPEYSANSIYYVEGYALIKNINFNKSIVVHYTYDNKYWHNSHAKILTITNDNHEIWYFKTPNTTTYNSCSFALFYSDDTNEYWDNNQNINYTLKWYSPTKILNNCIIILDKAIKNPTKFYGNILIKHPTYHKQVKVRYSFDNFETFQEINAAHSTQLENHLENWIFSVPISFSSNIKFIVYCIIDGITYYDNNFEKNYLI